MPRRLNVANRKAAAAVLVEPVYIVLRQLPAAAKSQQTDAPCRRNLYIPGPSVQQLGLKHYGNRPASATVDTQSRDPRDGEWAAIAKANELSPSLKTLLKTIH